MSESDGWVITIRFGPEDINTTSGTSVPGDPVALLDHVADAIGSWYPGFSGLISIRGEAEDDITDGC